ncbi:hypothetical protein I6G96_24220 [Delftia acidovorans]|uniref:hypothetical protein n=1 Tax=Delftia acidovorans TaxID=80866 RepID=UPI0018D872E2|nr:hypothetical protein [Delftia acidovorans]QPR34010.1 hypothetical protein I6G96_24220 [Delftia acidovorans]
MVDHPPDQLKSRALSAADWLNEIPLSSPPAAPIPPASAAEDVPPDPEQVEHALEQAMATEAVENSKQRRQLQFNYSEKAYGLVCGCLFGWACMLAASGMVNGVRGLPLWSDKVIMAVTTGVTVSVLAAFLSVIRGLFSDAALNGHEKGQAKQPKK